MHKRMQKNIVLSRDTECTLSAIECDSLKRANFPINVNYLQIKALAVV